MAAWWCLCLLDGIAHTSEVRKAKGRKARRCIFETENYSVRPRWFLSSVAEYSGSKSVASGSAGSLLEGLTGCRAQPTKDANQDGIAEW